MNFELKFNMDSFEDPEEIKMIFTVIGMKAANGQIGGTIKDSNGNTVGKWEINGEETFCDCPVMGFTVFHTKNCKNY